jgi:hypothetical protein
MESNRRRTEATTAGEIAETANVKKGRAGLDVTPESKDERGNSRCSQGWLYKVKLGEGGREPNENSETDVGEKEDETEVERCRSG